ncbi:ADP-ribosylglycohydrolase family protein [Neobittarella massiliensis]|uniref:ADP-ribosylglycohydrolase family protein n=1 Tax=Neobittarella massiliensis (ex Bilen et al. 2018) TaxID=2041842 RepID=UPI0013EA673C|nr:ADP-ribosylglycohydrolase family protein [Neobittarella massiliensis]
MTRKDKILGALLGAAIGDAMGAVTETKTTQAIVQRHGGFVTSLVDPVCDCFAHNNRRGMVTDDFSLVYLIGLAYIKEQGRVDQKTFEQVLIDWSMLDQYFLDHSGPNTKVEILRLKGEIPVDKYAHLKTRNHLITNGTAMKAAPMGFMNPGDYDRAITETIAMCMPTHPTDVAISAAAAVSCAVSEAMTESTSKDKIIQAALYGVKESCRRVRDTAYQVSGAKMDRRIEMAVELGLRYCHDTERLLWELASLVGTSLVCTESVAALFGLFIAAKNAFDMVVLGVNAGGDTDSMASIGGAIYGAYEGPGSFSDADRQLIEHMNFSDRDLTRHFDILGMADQLDAIIDKRRIPA